MNTMLFCWGAGLLLGLLVLAFVSADGKLPANIDRGDAPLTPAQMAINSRMSRDEENSLLYGAKNGRG